MFSSYQVVNKESILPTFYARLFRTKVSREAFLYLDLRFVLFWQKYVGAKAARNLLVKLTQGLHKTADRTIFCLKSTNIQKKICTGGISKIKK